MNVCLVDLFKQAMGNRDSSRIGGMGIKFLTQGKVKKISPHGAKLRALGRNFSDLSLGEVFYFPLPNLWGIYNSIFHFLYWSP